MIGILTLNIYLYVSFLISPEKLKEVRIDGITKIKMVKFFSYQRFGVEVFVFDMM